MPALLAETPEDAAHRRLQGTYELGDVVGIHALVVPEQEHPHLGVCHDAPSLAPAKNFRTFLATSGKIWFCCSSLRTFRSMVSGVPRQPRNFPSCSRETPAATLISRSSSPVIVTSQSPPRSQPKLPGPA